MTIQLILKHAAPPKHSPDVRNNHPILLTTRHDAPPVTALSALRLKNDLFIRRQKGI
jgi:hypothetical protein